MTTNNEIIKNQKHFIYAKQKYVYLNELMDKARADERAKVLSEATDKTIFEFENTIRKEERTKLIEMLENFAENYNTDFEQEYFKVLKLAIQKLKK